MPTYATRVQDDFEDDFMKRIDASVNFIVVYKPIGILEWLKMLICVCVHRLGDILKIYYSKYVYLKGQFHFDSHIPVLRICC